jgi:SNF2 family DNA or RNA helicase
MLIVTVVGCLNNMNALTTNVHGRFFKQGTLLRHYGEVLAIMVRLRQMCCHPFLVVKTASAVNDLIGIIIFCVQIYYFTFLL